MKTYDDYNEPFRITQIKMDRHHMTVAFTPDPKKITDPKERDMAFAMNTRPFDVYG